MRFICFRFFYIQITKKTRLKPIMDGKNKPVSFQLSQTFTGRNRRHLFIYFAVASVLWLFGAWNVSIAWILLLVSIYIFEEYRSRVRKRKRRNFRQILDESNFSKIKTFQIPRMHLSENENAMWLNEIINRLWPSIEGMTRQILTETVEPQIQKNLPTPLKSLHFDKMELGHKPPVIQNIKSYSGRSVDKPSEFIMDVDLFYNGNAQFKITVKNMKMGISDLQIYGRLRIILKPLLSNETLVGGVTVFFLKRPKIDFNLTNLLNVLDFPGLKKTLLGVVDDVIAGLMVLPNRIAIPLAASVDASDLQYPVPEGLLRVRLIGARDLVKSDLSLIGKGCPDPYAIVEVGAQTFCTVTRKNDSNPAWEETFEAFVDNSEGQELDVCLFDHDIASKDTKIGNVDVKIHSVVEEGVQDIWLPLKKAKQGKVHLKLEWFSLSSDPLHFRYTKDRESVAVLIVKVIKAQNLPNHKKSVLARKVYCRVSVGGITLTSFSTQKDVLEWRQSMRFLLTDPHEEAQIEVMEGNSCLGFALFNARRLIEQPDMMLQDSFPLLSNSGEDGKGSITCKFILRALKAMGTPSTPCSSQIGRKCRACCENGNCLDRTETPTMIPEVDGHDFTSSSESYSSEPTEKASSLSSTSDSSPSGSIAEEGSSSQSSEVSGLGYLARGEVSLRLIYDHRRNRLVVTILSAKIISSKELASKTNPYVHVNLLPSRSKKSIRKTFSFPGSLHPVFNQSFDYVIGLDQLVNKQLQIAVKNERFLQLPGKRRDLIGTTYIKLCELSLSTGVTVNCELTT